jgi:hypothetical protein
MLTKFISENMTFWVDLTQVERIAMIDGDDKGTIYMRSGSSFKLVNLGIPSLVELINGAPTSAPTSPAADGPARTLPGEFAVITRIVRDEFYSKTSGEHRAMWRCTTNQGMTFNIFDHADPARNTYKMFFDAGYDKLLGLMAMGDYFTFSGFNCIPVRLERDGTFWKPVHVEQNAGYFPDPDESAADDDDWNPGMTNNPDEIDDNPYDD